MAWESGYSTDYRDLLLRLKQFVSGHSLITIPIVSGTGDGVLHGIKTTLNSTPAETWTVTCTDDMIPATFSVVGSVSGAQADATVDVPYDNSIVEFTITAGSVDFVVGDSFTFDTFVNPLVAAVETWEVKRFTGTGAKVVNYLVSSVYDGSGQYNAEKAVDPSTTTYWSSQTYSAAGAWWQVEFDLPVDIRKLSLGGYTFNNTQSEAPKEFTVSYSDDGNTFTPDSTFSDEIDWLTNETREFNLAGTSGAHKFWRVTIVSVDSNSPATPVRFYDLRMFSVDNPHFNVAYYGDGYDCILRGPGTASGDDIYAIIRPDAFVHHGPNLIVEGALGYSAGLDSLAQPGNSNLTVLETIPDNSRLALFDAPFKYWLRVSGRLITIAARFQSISEIGQLGFFLQYAMPEQSQYPYPFILAGSQAGGGISYSTKFKWDRVDEGHSLLFSPNCAPGSNLSTHEQVPSPVRVYTPYNKWKQITHKFLGNNITESSKALSTSPYLSRRQGGNGVTYAHKLTKMCNEKIPLTPICIVDTEYDATYGELDGLKHVPGVHSVESIVTDDDNYDWVILNNVFRVGDTDFVAMRLV